MPVSYRYDSDDNIVVARPVGVLTVDDACSYFREVAGDRNVVARFVEVVHFDGVTDFAFRFSEASMILSTYAECMLAKQCVGSVLVAKADHAYGIARMLSLAFGEPETIRVVRNDAELAETLAEIRSGDFPTQS